jgi:hypothetical protein
VTQFAKPVAQRPQNWLAQLRALAAANAATSTQYVVEHPPRTKKEAEEEIPESERGVCTAIIGNLAAEPDGTSTGLSGWGIAVLANGVWVSLGEGSPYVALEGVNAALEPDATYDTPGVTMDSAVRLQGAWAVRAGKSLPTGSTLATVPPAYRPVKPVRYSMVIAPLVAERYAGYLTVEPSGVMIASYLGPEAKEGVAFHITGATWSL